MIAHESSDAPPNWGRIAVTYRPIADLKPNPRNPRRHSRQQVRALERSIREFGFIGAVIINRGCMILAGHALWLAAMRAGLKEVPTIEVKIGRAHV